MPRECPPAFRSARAVAGIDSAKQRFVPPQAFETLIKQSEGLERLWTALLTRPDKALAAERAVDCEMTIQLGEYKFVMPALGFGGRPERIMEPDCHGKLAVNFPL